MEELADLQDRCIRTGAELPLAAQVQVDWRCQGAGVQFQPSWRAAAGRETLAKVDDTVAAEDLATTVNVYANIVCFQRQVGCSHGFHDVRNGRQTVVPAHQRAPHHSAERDAGRLQAHRLRIRLSRIDLVIPIRVGPIRPVQACEQADVLTGQRQHRHVACHAAPDRRFNRDRLDVQHRQCEIAESVRKSTERDVGVYCHRIQLEIVAEKLPQGVIDPRACGLHKAPADQFLGNQLQPIRLLHDVEVQRTVTESVQSQPVGKDAADRREGQKIKGVARLRNESASQRDLERPVQNGRSGHVDPIPTEARADLDLQGPPGLLCVAVDRLAVDHARIAEGLPRLDEHVVG